MYQGLDYQITDVIQLNRAKFIFNRAEKKKPNTCEGVRPFPTSGYYIDDLQVSE